jgi:hypothetical protein
VKGPKSGPEGVKMSVFQEVDLAIVLWGALVLAASTVRYYYFGARCIQIELPAHSRRRWFGLGRD